jgi:hypothetical protein
MKRINAMAAVRRQPATIFGIVAGLLLCVICIPDARADNVVSDTTLVAGTETAVFSFEAPGPGTITAQLTNLSWPQPLTSLNFLATTAGEVMSAWSTTTSQSGSFQVTGPGMYFADITASAGGPLDLGVYSLSISFAPAGPVPLPAGGWLLLTALLILIGWRAARGRTFTVAPRPRAAL